MEKGNLIFGLIGFPLGHSWSAEFFNEKFRLAGDCTKLYRLFPIKTLDAFPGLLTGFPELAGLNVTIPYKEKIITYLDNLDHTARSIGAVNTIKITRKDGAILTKGFNTDAGGFSMTLAGQPIKGPALILGTGGAGLAVAYALREKHIRYTFVSRKKAGPGIMNYHDINPDHIRDHPLIINTTPLGMYPDINGSPPIPYQYLTKDHCLYDIIYNPEETEFLKQGKAMNCHVINGKQMLINQAELSLEIFLGTAQHEPSQFRRILY